MRYQGRIASWNSQRGFGFIKQEQGGADLFVHITTLQFDGRPPEVGEKVSYLIGSSKDGKPCAVQVFFPDRPLSLAGGPMPSMPDRGSREDLSPRAPHATTYRTREYHAPRRKGSWGGKLIPLLVLAGLFSLYSRFSAEFASLSSFPSFSQEDSTSNSTVQVPTFVRQCDGRQHCSQMTSCEEATWFLQNCPNTKMDGEGDGIPCERQWCGH
ncbi:cold shock domain-containing protein [Aeromonas caviae]